MKIVDGKLVAENLAEQDQINQVQMRIWWREIEDMANGDKNEEIRLKVALLKSLQKNG